MGDAGVATSPDVYSMHWNPAKFAFIDGNGGVGISYSPWLRNLVPDINIAYLTGYKRIDTKQVLAGKSYFIHLLEMCHSQMNLAILERTFNPNEFAIRCRIFKVIH